MWFLIKWLDLASESSKDFVVKKYQKYEFALIVWLIPRPKLATLAIIWDKISIVPASFYVLVTILLEV